MLARASRRQKLVVALLSQNGAMRAKEVEEKVELEEGDSEIERSSLARTLRKLESRGLVLRYGGSSNTYQATLPAIIIPEQVRIEWLAPTMKGKDAGQEVLREHHDGRAKFNLSVFCSESYTRVD